jgi:hypothetical protein
MLLVLGLLRLRVISLIPILRLILILRLRVIRITIPHQAPEDVLVNFAKEGELEGILKVDVRRSVARSCNTYAYMMIFFHSAQARSACSLNFFTVTYRLPILVVVQVMLNLNGLQY